jgi:hypothetical protein
VTDLPLVQKQFVIKASQERVWNLLARTVFGVLPLEKMNLVNATTTYAVLRWRLAFVSVPLNIKIELQDVSSPSLFGSKISVNKSILHLTVRVRLVLRVVNDSETEVTCIALEEGKGTILGRLLRAQQRNFAMNVFDRIRQRLEQIC